MHGYYGRILIIDLSARSSSIRSLSEAELELGGGKGLASRLLLEMNPPQTDAFGPDNHLIFAAGPICGTAVWGGSRYGVYTKSPLTGGYAESYSGGKTPEAVDAAGFDAVVIHGVAAEPVMLVVHPEGCEIVEAKSMWGKDTYESEDTAKARAAELFPEFKKCGAAVIGPAAENLVRFGLIENDYWRSAGRAGAGAVMGAKKLKAVAFTGDRKREVADPEGLKQYAKEFMAGAKENPGVKAYKARGTTQMVALMNTAGAFPARYWTQGTCDHWEKLSGDRFHEEFKVSPHACLKCFMACGRMTEVPDGKYKGLKLEGPEYETIFAFGGLCMIEDMDEIIHLNDVCDRLGMDTISAGNLCAFTIEAVRRGKAEYAIDYNDPAGAEALIRDIAARKGLGDLLAEGIVPAARKLGLEDLAVHVKGMEPPGYDPRVLKGMGLTYAVTARGACHLRTTFYKPELAGMIPPDQIEGKAELLVDFEDRLTIFDTLILCRFYRDLYTWDQLETVIGLVCGTKADTKNLRIRAAKIADTTKQFNLREGVGSDQDRLPKRIYNEALPSGHSLDESEMQTMLQEYYRLRGWDENGIPPSQH